MKGLLLKDWKLMKSQARFMMVILGISIVISFSGVTGYASFMTSYLTFIFSMFVLSTLSYDSYDNGMIFLLSLPVSRKTYVQEKYLFSLLVTSGSWLLSLLLRLLILFPQLPEGEIPEIFIPDLIYLVLVLLFIAFSLPLHLKFGNEKGRMLSFGFLGLLVMGFFTIIKIDRGHALFTAINHIFSHSSGPLITAATFFCIICFGISFFLSLWIMEKKEF